MNLIKSLNILNFSKIQKKRVCFLLKNQGNKQLLNCLLNLNYLINFKINNKTLSVYINYNNTKKIKIILKLSFLKKIKYSILKKYYNFFYINNFLILTSHGLLSSYEVMNLKIGGVIIAYLY